MPREMNKAAVAERRSTAVMSPVKSAMRSPVKSLPLNDDREEKSVRFKSRQALHELQMNSLKAAVTPRNKRQSMAQAGGSPHTPSNGADNDKENGDRLDSVAGNAVTPMKRVPILANFEEWMKMATDNKINATNSWNFALIDYFHDMSLLREGDSVNFQKASCTLDGCVKIYTSRVDSVATETGKLLSGLADSNSNGKKRRGEEDENEGDEDDEEEGEDGVVKKRPKKKVQRSSEATLASSFAQLQLKKMDLEFSVDPLFKKATADFDEGGAKGLLLNHLTIDSNGRIVFDSSDDVQQQDRDAEEDATPAPEPEEQKPAAQPIDMDSLAAKFFPDLSKLDEQDICPSLKTFELGGAAEALDIPFLKAGDDWKKDLPEPTTDESGDAVMTNVDDDDGVNLGGFDIADDADVGFGQGGEAWAREAAIETQGRPFEGVLNEDGDGDNEGEPGSGNVGGYEADGASYGVTLSQHHDPENILSYFDKALSKNWAGPEHWRIRKIRDAHTAKPAPRARREKEPFVIDFSAPMSRTLHDALHTSAASASAISLPRAQWRSKTRNLLPDDKHFNSRQLLRLFLKPKARIGARRPGPSSRNLNAAPHASGDAEDPHAEMDPAFWAQRHAEAAASAAEQDGALTAHGDYDADFFADDGLGSAAGPEDDDVDEDGAFADAREAFSPGAPDIPGGGGIAAAIAAAAAGGAESTNGEPGGFGSQLVTASRRARPEYVQYARTAKKVDVRRLKEEMWRGLAFAAEDAGDAEREATPQPEKKPDEEHADDRRFTNVVRGLSSAYAPAQLADISTSYCFICLLHLANEKGLVLVNDGQTPSADKMEVDGEAMARELNEIRIWRDRTADLSAGDMDA